MGQYLQFRSWLRTSSGAEKKLVAAVLVVVLGLAAWALVPTAGPGGSSIFAGGGAGSASTPGLPSATAGSGGAAGPASRAGSGTASGGSSAAGSASAPTGASGAASAASGGGVSGPGAANASGSAGATGSCGALTSTDTGVTPTQIKVAAVLLNLAGAIGNSAVGQSSPQVQQQMAQAVVDDINAHGGVDCRKLVVSYYQANPIDPTSTQNVCLQIQQAGVFAVIGGFAYPVGANDCLTQQKIPVVANIAGAPSEIRQYYPYLMSAAPDPVQDYANSILGLKSRGWFTSAQGFKKLAILEDDCSPEIDQAVYNLLTQAGVSPGQIVKNDFSCPASGFASPGDMSNFATQDHLAGVTNVVEATGGGSFKEYTSAAQSQSYKPRYLVSEYNGFMVTATGSTGPDPNNFDGTVVTTDTRFGETSTPGLTDPGTQACIALFARHGLPSSYVTGSYLGGSNCALFGLFAAAAAHDSGPTRRGLASGLGQVGRFAMPYPLADSIYRLPGRFTPVKITGGDFWWTVQFYASCTCWKVIDPTERSSFE